jgi:ATP-dependent helicase/nuclease subunit A
MNLSGKNHSLTKAQQRAVEARGNVLVMAGAGTGKTKTLVERCLDCLQRDGAQIDELLVVTFTEAAAAEMRQRLRRELEKSPKLSEQLALFDLSHIGTLHSFCLKLVREHFYRLELDPQLAILDEGEARQLANETLDEQFASHYEGEGEFSVAVQDLIQIHGGGRDERIRKLILRLHDYSQTRPDAAGWLTEQVEKFSAREPTEWQTWLFDAIAVWRDDWLLVLENLKSENVKAAELAGILSHLQKRFAREAAAEILAQIATADETSSYQGKAGKLRPTLGKIFKEAKFLRSLAAVENGNDPLAEDWSWVHGHMETLLRLTEEFAHEFSKRKHAESVLDFHDLEQFALKLLWDLSANKPTDVAESWRAKLKFVFVDEYQDINAAQDKIIAALSRDGAKANRFLVGDVKQSIYRFRLADPTIFRGYANDWRCKPGLTIPLAENFRSHAPLLDFVNSVFGLIMRDEIGSVEYDKDAKLKAAREDASPTETMPRVELLLRFKEGRNEISNEEYGEFADLGEMEKEVRLLAQRLRELKDSGHKIWDREKEIFRTADWRDMAILLRSPRGKSEIFAKEFERTGVPLAVACGRFYESAEILDLLSLLQLLDNPLQDVPCIAVLRSPLVALSVDELAEIRLAAKDKHFWAALNRIQNSKLKIKNFLERYSRWRKMAKQISLSQCLEEIFAETSYAGWLRAQSRGAQRAANVAAFLHLAQQFDQFHRQGLFRFLKFIAEQQEAEVEPEVPAVATENAVRLMSIHQSKGLEFPVVALADLSKRFNEQDLNGEIIFDEEFGLCPKVKPPERGGRYPSLPHWLARRRQKRELRGEELRLLYVGMTRARDNLILTTSISEKNWDEKWNQPQPATTQKIAEANCFADWLAIWFSNQNGKSENLRWQIADDAKLATKVESGKRKAKTKVSSFDDATIDKLRKRLEWSYQDKSATERKAKSSVTTLRREGEESDDEAEQIFAPRFSQKRLTRTHSPPKRKLSAAEIGAAHHKFLQHFSIEIAVDLKSFEIEARRLEKENHLSVDERVALDLKRLVDFWNSEIGKRIRKQAKNVNRELPFTARFSPAEIVKITSGKIEAGLENEFVVVQGVADLVVILQREIWLVDFKTDEIHSAELPEKIKIYAPQLNFYASALGRIYNRQVTNCWLHFLSTGKTVDLNT